ncbi:MAG: hypothetical protein V3S81_05565 [Anaerolineales bacterium]
MPKTKFSRSHVAQTGEIPMGSNFLQESFPLQIKDMKEVVVEGINGGKPVMRITGVFQKADDANQNHRVYPRDILAQAVANLQEGIGARKVMGEFDHPPDAKIHLDRVSHLITKVWMEGKYVYGEAEVLEGTPQGQTLAALLRAGVQVGISSRGVGDMEIVSEGTDSEQYIVQEGYEFVTWDVVGEPSVEEATMSVMESRKRNRQLITRATLRKNQNPEAGVMESLNQWLRGDIDG